MRLIKVLKTLWGENKPSSHPRRPGFIPRLESLEDRAVPATFTVVNLNDVGVGSLRAAITSANGAAENVVQFQAGLTGTIQLASQLPTLTKSMMIDGPGSNVIDIAGSGSATTPSVYSRSLATLPARSTIFRSVMDTSPAMAGQCTTPGL